MKKQIIKTSMLVALLMGLSALNARASTSGESLGICVNNDQSQPLPNCIPSFSTTLTWVTGTAACKATSGNSDCWSTTITNATKHTVSVSWSSFFAYNPGNFQQIGEAGEGGEWVFPHFIDPAYCDFYQGLTMVNNVENQVFICYNYSLGADTTTDTSGGSCQELDF